MTTMTAAIKLQWLERADKVLAQNYRRPENIFTHGEGCTLVDTQGQSYLDMTSGVAVNALGYNSKIISQAIQQSSRGLVHTSNLFHTTPAIYLAELLVEGSFADKVFFCNSGAESVEAALKFALLFHNGQRQKVHCFKGSFHGRTLGALGLTDIPDHHTLYGTPKHGTFHQFNDMSALDNIDESSCAVILEIIQGEGGIRVVDTDWIRALRARCDEKGALLIIDEVQTGLGRTGQLWAYQWTNIEPDLMTVAKPLAGGLPMGAVMMNQRVAESIRPGLHATTFGGGPFVANIASRVVETLSNPAFLADIQDRSLYLLDLLRALDHPFIEEIRGLGLLLGLKMRCPAKSVVQAAYEQKLLLVPARDNVVRFIPPLTISREDLREAVKRLALALEGVARS